MTGRQPAMALLQMRDAVPPIPRLADATVLLTDRQEEHRSGDLIRQHGSGNPSRSGGAHASPGSGRPCRPRRPRGRSGRGGRPHGAARWLRRELTPALGEVVVEKTAPSAFTHMSLAKVLDDGGRRPLVVGAMSHTCVSSTLRVAAELGHNS